MRCQTQEKTRDRKRSLPHCCDSGVHHVLLEASMKHNRTGQLQFERTTLKEVDLDQRRIKPRKQKRMARASTSKDAAPTTSHDV